MLVLCSQAWHLIKPQQCLGAQGHLFLELTRTHPLVQDIDINNDFKMKIPRGLMISEYNANRFRQFLLLTPSPK
jgi:hypothetical protein